MSVSWYALNVKPHKERSVVRLLEAREEIEVFFPSIPVRPKNPRAARIRPYFPGYLFVRFNLEQEGSNALEWTPGTKGLVRFGEIPAVVPESFIQSLRKHLQAIEEAGGLQPPALRQGERVRIVQGPFAGYEAIFDVHLDGRDRVQVLLAFLSRQLHKVQLDREAIEQIKP